MTQTEQWNPSLIYLIDKIESVQRTFTKRLPGFKDMDYESRLRELKLQSLEHCRLIDDLVICFGIIHDFSSLKFQDFFKFSNNKHSRGHKFKIEIQLSRSSLRYQFFANRIIKPWNSLPDNLVTPSTIKSFKNKLYKLDLPNFIKHPCIYSV